MRHAFNDNNKPIRRNGAPYIHNDKPDLCEDEASASASESQNHPTKATRHKAQAKTEHALKTKTAIFVGGDGSDAKDDAWPWHWQMKRERLSGI